MLHRTHSRLGLIAVAALFTTAIHGDSAAEQKLDAKRNLIVFVGQKLNVVEQPAEENSWDFKFEARFRVLQRIFGRYDEPEITFTVYDHYAYGGPGFAKYDTVLMFVVRSEGKFYHLKYQFVPVYRTENGRWASCGDAAKWNFGAYEFDPKLKPVPIKFADKAPDEADGRPCAEGNYVEDLFSLKRNSILKRDGWVF